MMRNLPISIQSFEDIRDRGCLYVDKTEYIYQLTHTGKQYFLSRPRRFGKSLFLSMLKCYWEGRRELFEELKIVELTEGDREAWLPHPVFYLDFNKDSFRKKGALEDVLSEHLERWEKQYGCEERTDATGIGKGNEVNSAKSQNDAESKLARRFRSLLELAVDQTGRRAVVLVDEYDKPLLETMNDPELHDHNRAVYKSFFSSLKSYDGYLRFVFITGVTKFSKVSIFSDLNQLVDISMTAQYACVCGITEEELREYFSPEVEALASQNGLTLDSCYDELRQRYDGYRFHGGAKGVYNPFSLLNTFLKQEFGEYWYESGTPSFLLDKLEEVGFDAKAFTERELYSTGRALSDYQAESEDPLPLFYQTGYLTIKGYDARRQRYTLAYPNDEVKYGFLESLAPSFMHSASGKTDMDIFRIDDCIESGDLEGMRKILTALFARLPYVTDEKPVEQNFQNVIYIVFMLLGKYVHTEVHSAKGRADCVVETEKYVYIFEFKRDETAGEALEQIDTQGYAVAYEADRRKLYKIGANFSSKTRTLDGWEVQERLCEPWE